MSKQLVFMKAISLIFDSHCHTHDHNIDYCRFGDVAAVVRFGAVTPYLTAVGLAADVHWHHSKQFPRQIGEYQLQLQLGICVPNRHRHHLLGSMVTDGPALPTGDVGAEAD